MLCYGHNWIGLDSSEPVANASRGHAPKVFVNQVVAQSIYGDTQTGEEGQLRLPLVTGGSILADRKAATATYRVPELIPIEELVHPYLVPAAAVFSSWAGREAYHAGAVVVNGRAWAVVGEGGSGKSTTVAMLAARGYPVVTDDLLVLEGRHTFPGPRLVDLRASAARRLGVGNQLRSARKGGRWRMLLAPVLEAELAGWIYLRWGNEISIRRVDPTERVRRLLALRPTRPEAVVELATLPTYEFTRPRDWERLGGALERLLHIIS